MRNWIAVIFDFLLLVQFCVVRVCGCENFYLSGNKFSANSNANKKHLTNYIQTDYIIRTQKIFNVYDFPQKFSHIARVEHQHNDYADKSIKEKCLLLFFLVENIVLSFLFCCFRFVAKVYIFGTVLCCLLYFDGNCSWAP